MHVIRILGTNKNGDVLRELWVDVLRVDEWAATDHLHGTWQKTVYRHFWNDDPDKGDATGNPSRKTTKVKIVPPDGNLTDPEEFIEVRISDVLTFLRHGLKGVKGQKVKVRQDNVNGRDARSTSTRRVVHYDTNIDDEANAAFDADPSRSVYVVSYDKYEKLQDTKDTGQYLEVEVPTKFSSLASGLSGTGRGDDQGEVYKLYNQFIVEQTDESQGGTVGANSINPPWRLDTTQFVINVQFKTSLPKYAFISGYSGNHTVILFSVDEKTGDLKIVGLDNPCDYSGYPLPLRPAGTALDHLSDITSYCISSVMDFDGTVFLDSGDPAFAAGSWLYTQNFTNPVGIEPPKTPLGISRYLNPDGNDVSGFTPFPSKGRLVNGLYGNKTSVSKYAGETLVWSTPVQQLYEILTGGRLLVAVEFNKLAVVQLDLETGAVKSTTILNGTVPDPNILDWETTPSGGVILSWTLFDDPGVPTSSTLTFQRVSLDNQVIWSKSSTVVAPFAGGLGFIFSSGNYRRPLMVQNKRGKTYVIIGDLTDLEQVGGRPGGLIQVGFVNVVKIFDFETGSLLRTITWGAQSHEFADNVDFTPIETDTYERQFHHITNSGSNGTFN